MNDLSSGPAAAGRSPWLVFAGLLLVALVLRGWQFGNPLVHPDEGFYLLAGDRLITGTVAYAEIWDSKPMGLFLVYSAIRLLGGDGIIQYQIVATLFAAATAFLIYRAARAYAPAGALPAAAAYLLYMLAFGGVGGQSPVFYNLLVIVAALLTFRAVDPASAKRPSLRMAGIGIMLILGLALQVKYAMLFEGIFMGLALLWRGRMDGRSLATQALDAVIWIACALVPTAALMILFFASGHGDAFMFGNFLSILGRDDPLLPSLGRLALHAVMMAPLWVVMRKLLRMYERPIPGFFLYWLGAATAGYVVFGSYYDHYSLPMLVPLTIVCAPLLALSGPRRTLTLVVLGWGLLVGVGKAVFDRIERGGPAEASYMADTISSGLRQGGCLYIYEGDPILYHLTRACLATRFAFPGHLSNAKHIDSLGLDTVGEVRKIMATRPAAVVAAEYPRSLTNAGSRAALAEALRRDYRHRETVQAGKRRWMIFERVEPGTGDAILPLEQEGGDPLV